MNTEMVETYRYLRDYGKPISQQDAADYAKIREPQPPSKSLCKRIRRGQLGLNPRPLRDPRPYPDHFQAERAACDRRMAFHRKLIGDLGGSLTIKPTSPEAVRRDYLNYVAPARDVAATDPQVAYDREAKRLDRIRIVALGRRMFTDYQPDMFQVLDAFGSFREYGKDV